MQGRNRSPVEAMRPGMGRISPERSYHKNQGFYGGAGSRNFRRGGGGGYRRGPPKPHFPYPPPPPPPPSRRKIDVLMEAGRLAAEYLVSKGVLSPSSLPRSGANGGVHEFKGRERENVGYEGRVSALNRLGNSDGGAGKRRYGGGGSNNSDEYDNVGTRNSSVARGRKRRVDHYTVNSHGSEWKRESKRSGQWMDRSRSFGDNPSNNGTGNNIGDFSDGDFAPGFRQGGFEDSGRGSRVSGAVVEGEGLPKNDDVGDESDTDTSDFPDDVVLKDCFSRARKASPKETESGLNKEVRDPQAMGVKTANGKGDDRSSTDMEEEVSGNSTVRGHVAVCREGSEQGSDLLRSCGFMKVPTRPRTPMGNRILKVSRSPEIAETERTYQQSIIENDKITDIVSDAGPKLEAEKSSINRSPIKELTDLTHNSVCSMSENSASPTVQHIEQPKDQTSDLTTDVEGCNKIFPVSEISQLQNQPSNDMVGSVCDTSNKDYTKLLTLSERSVAHNPVKLSHNSSFGAPLVDLDSKKKDGFPLQGALSEGIKRPSDWSSSIGLHDNDYVQMHHSSAHKSYSSGLNLIHDGEMIESIDQKKLVDAELLPKTEQVASMEVKKEKQFMPNSFKICDLNLIEGHDITEIPDDRVPANTSGNSLSMETRTVPSVEFGLSVGHNNNGTNLYGQCANDNKAIQVIDLANDSSAGGCACEHSRPKSEAMYSNLDNLLNQTDNSNTVDLHDIHDGYGLPISDLLGPDIPTCPPISGEANNLQQGMNLLEEGLPCDDDSIYVSLSELPLSFMDAWDPPPQEYGKSQQHGGSLLQ